MNLRFLVIDSVHLVIAYQSAKHKKKTKGLQLLRVIQNKFNLYDEDFPVELSSPFVNGEMQFGVRETKVYAHLKGRNMGQRESKSRLDQFDGSKPYYSYYDYIADMAALCSV